MTQTTSFLVQTGIDDQMVGTSGTTYPPSGNFVRSTSTFNHNVTRSKIGADYFVQNALLAFDTSSLPATANVVSATLRFYTNQNDSVDSRNLTGEWYAWDGSSNSDHSTTPVDTAFSVPLSSLVLEAPNDVAIANPNSGISKTGYTKMRLHIDGGQPTGLNRINLSMYESTFFPQAELEIDYQEPGEPHSYSSASNGLSDTLVIPQPTTPEAVEQNDALLASIAVNGGTDADVTPDDDSWTLVTGGRVDLGTDLAGFLFRRVATNSEPSSHTFTLDAERHASGSIVALQNTQGSSPIAVLVSQTNASASTNVVAPTLTTQAVEERLLFVGMTDGVATFTPPAGMTELTDQSG